MDIGSFIRDSRLKGMSDNAIKSALLNMGAAPAEVNAALPAFVQPQPQPQAVVQQEVQPQVTAPQGVQPNVTPAQQIQPHITAAQGIQPQAASPLIKAEPKIVPAEPVQPAHPPQTEIELSRIIKEAQAKMGATSFSPKPQAVEPPGIKEAVAKTVGTLGAEPAAPSGGMSATNVVFGNRPAVATVPSEPSPKNKKLLAIIIAAVLILGGGGGAYAYYSYINSPPQVLAATLANLKKITSFSMSSDLKVFASSTKLKAVDGKESGNIELTTTGDIEFADPRQPNFSLGSTLATDIIPGFGSVDLSMIFLSAEKAFYFKLGNLGKGLPIDFTDLNDVWIAVKSATTTASSSETGLSPIPNLNLDASKVVDAAASSTLLSNPAITILKEFPRETINGQDSFHYQLGLDEEKLKNDPLIQQKLKDGSLKSEDFQKGLDQAKQTQIEIWVSKAARLPVKLALHDESQDANSTSWKVDFIATFTNINEKVSIAAPEASRPIEEVFGEVMVKIFGGTVQVAPTSTPSASFPKAKSGSELAMQNNDSRRISDLSTLKSAIYLYLANVSNPLLCQKGKTYKSNSGTDAVDGTGWLPINFNSISSGSPLLKLPKDPTNNLNYFYSYACDPVQYILELNAKMESQKYGKGGASDVVSNDGGDNTAVYEAGNAPGLKILH